MDTAPSVWIKDMLVSDYERKVLEKYGLGPLLDKLIFRQVQLEERNFALEAKLQAVDHDLSNAREAQMNLLPKKIDHVEEIEFSARFFPSAYVSGDTYNVFRLDENRIGAYQLDISGHGVAAALFSVSLSQMLNANVTQNNFLKTTLRKAPYYHINTPSEVFALLDKQSFFERYGFYFTMMYMILNIRTGELQFSRAGHHPPIILRVNGHMEIPQEGGLPLGWNFSRTDPIVRTQLNAGDRIFMFSDGLIEATNKHEEWFGQDRLSAVFKNNLMSTLDKTLDTTISELASFTHRTTFEDDISLLGITFLGNNKHT